jgi:predicted DNA-binding protein (UPF0251 family)
MSHIIAWIAAVAESEDEAPHSPPPCETEVRRDSKGAIDGPSIENLPAHQFPRVTKQDPQLNSPETLDIFDDWYEFDQRRRAYRGRTVAMLRRFMRYSLETGRLPSLVGREFFRSKVTQYRVTTFEDRVIFVHDMERCLGRLDEFSRQVLARIVLQEYEQEEAAQLLGCTRRSIYRWLMEALDKLSDILIAAGLLEIVPPLVENSCQGGDAEDFCASDEEERK